MLQEKIYTVSTTPYLKQVTVITDTDIRPKGCVIYFHGGGLLYGDRDDLPQLHKELFTQAGYAVWACDYPLAPASILPEIMESTLDSIRDYAEHAAERLGEKVPYFLFGRSAGAYLALMTAASEGLAMKPSGVISFYGYGFFLDNWFMEPDPWYQKLPKVPASILDHVSKEKHVSGALDPYYSLYVYARQTGAWKDLIYQGRDKFFYLDYTLRLKDSLGAPLFALHNTGDPDIPFGEFTELCAKYPPKDRFIVAGDEHDFDRNESNPVVRMAFARMLAFMDSCLA